MRRDEFHAISQCEFRVEIAEFVAAPAILRVTVNGFRAEGAVRREGFKSCVNGDKGIVIGADDGGENRHSWLEVDADAAVGKIHHDVGAALKFGDVRQAEVDIPASSAASGEDFRWPPFGCE